MVNDKEATLAVQHELLLYSLGTIHEDDILPLFPEFCIYVREGKCGTKLLRWLTAVRRLAIFILVLQLGRSSLWEEYTSLENDWRYIFLKHEHC